MSDNQQGTVRGVGSDQTSQTQGYSTNTTGDVVIPKYEEQLVPEKVEQQEGMVHVHKDVVSEQQTVSAPVTHEEVDVERVPVHNQLDTAPADAFQETDLNIPLRGEELVAGKQVVESEEVHLRKHQVQEQEQVSGTVRREQVEVDQPTETATTETVATAQTTPVQSTTTDTVDTSASTLSAARTTPLQGTTTAATMGGVDTSAQSAPTQQGTSTTYRIEADPVQENVQQTGATTQSTVQQASGSAQGGAQQAASNAQQGAGDAKSKLDSAIDGVADKLLGHNH